MKPLHLAAMAALAFGTVAAQAALDTRLVAGGLDRPVFATAPLNDGRVFIVERAGRIRVAQNGVLSDFLSLDVAVDGASERGLLGLAFDPGYADATSPGYRRFFVYYTEPITLHSVIASYRSGADPSQALPGSRQEVLRIDESAAAAYHKGGWLGFKPGDADHLYLGVGDGTNRAAAQSTASLLGKILRIDVNRDDFAANPNLHYGIPGDNPFVGSPGARGEVFALGLRNPWRNSFDQLRGDLWIADVGQSTREEVNLLPAGSPGGQNFGWAHREGTVVGPAGDDPPGTGFTDPLFDYGRAIGGSVIGGYVVRDPAVDSLAGHYVFGDWVRGKVWAMPEGQDAMSSAIDLSDALDAGQAGALSRISSFGEGAAGQLYIVDYGASGALGKVVQVVPEPGTWMLLLGGLVALGVAARRQARRPAG